MERNIMKSKNLIRTLVLAGLVSYPGYETYNYYVARQQLAASIALRDSVSEKWASARVKYAQAPVVTQSPTAQP